MPAVALCVGLGLACGDDPTDGALECGDAPGISVGESLTGTLSETDRTLARSYIDYYVLELSDSLALAIEMSSDDVDPFVYLFDDRGRVIGQAFHETGEGETLAAALADTLARGCYRIGASSWVEVNDSTGAMGAYTLRVDSLAP